MTTEELEAEVTRLKDELHRVSKIAGERDLTGQVEDQACGIGLVDRLRGIYVAEPGDPQGGRRFRASSINLEAAAAITGLTIASEAVLTLLEVEGRDTGMGGPLSDLRDAVARTKVW